MHEFYDRLASNYHLIFDDWEESMRRQGHQLSEIIREVWPKGVSQILDVSCGIGTQAFALAKQGFKLTGSDLSPESVARAQQEAKARKLEIDFSVCDMRWAAAHHECVYDLAISCDNSLPHLLSEEEILTSLVQMKACVHHGGGCLVTLRDYDKEKRGRHLIKPYGIRDHQGKRFLVVSVWDFDGDQYDLTIYLTEDDHEQAVASTQVFRSRYLALSPKRLLNLMVEAGFTRVRRIDDVYYQPVLVGTKP